jgi:two-component system NarL family response regulator
LHHLASAVEVAAHKKLTSLHMNEAQHIRLVIVDDDQRLLEDLETILGAESGFCLIGCYESVEEAIEEVKWPEVDVLLCDLSLPGESGETLILRATTINKDLHAVAFTVHDDRQSLFNALRAGAESYIIKGLSVSETIAAVKSAFEGIPVLSPPVARFLIEDFRSRATEHGDILSIREVEILKLSAEGLIYKEIADRLCISPGTVHSHIKRIYRKLQASNRQHAIQRAEDLGYLPPQVSENT